MACSPRSNHPKDRSRTYSNPSFEENANQHRSQQKNSPSQGYHYLNPHLLHQTPKRRPTVKHLNQLSLQKRDRACDLERRTPKRRLPLQRTTPKLRHPPLHHHPAPCPRNYSVSSKPYNLHYEPTSRLLPRTHHNDLPSSSSNPNDTTEASLPTSEPSIASSQSQVLYQPTLSPPQVRSATATQTLYSMAQHRRPKISMTRISSAAQN